MDAEGRVRPETAVPGLPLNILAIKEGNAAMNQHKMECRARTTKSIRKAAQGGNVGAISRCFRKSSDPNERICWLRQAAEAGDVEAMYTYSQECEDSTEAEYWLRKTACEGHVQAMYDYAMQCNDFKERRQWLMRAANQGWEAAAEALEALE